MTQETSQIPLAEIFYSLQGEGHFSGTASIFIRVAGCNLACAFCDTDFSLKKKYSVKNILDKIKDYPARHVVLTGGEPTLYPQELKPLVQALQAQDYFVALETNGTAMDTLGVDWVCVSPKPQEKNSSGKLLNWVLKQGNEIKIPYEGQDLSPYEIEGFTHYFLQPIEVRTELWGKGEINIELTQTNRQKCIDKILQSPRWKLSLQTHKILNIR
jgi:7-carboxy-7-deazaguanine synthase